MGKKALIAVVLFLSCFAVMFLIVGGPGYFQPNPVIAIRVAIGVVIGLIVVCYT